MEIIAVVFALAVFAIIRHILKNKDGAANREAKVKAAADFKNLFEASHTTSLAQSLIDTAYRAAQDELKGLKDKGAGGLDLKQISERSAEIDTAVKKLKDLKIMAEALDFTVPNEKEN